jgi:acetylornithine deacetylase/succinyl-diaminopimelate desuccinylase-like protein
VENIVELVRSVVKSTLPQLDEPIQLEVVRSMYPFQVEPQAALVRDLKDAIKEVRGSQPQPGHVPFSSNAGYVAAEMGAEAVLFGPGKIETLNEVEIDEVLAAARVYEAGLRRVWLRLGGDAATSTAQEGTVNPRLSANSHE